MSSVCRPPRPQVSSIITMVAGVVDLAASLVLHRKARFTADRQLSSAAHCPTEDDIWMPALQVVGTLLPQYFCSAYWGRPVMRNTHCSAGATNRGFNNHSRQTLRGYVALLTVERACHVQSQKDSAQAIPYRRLVCQQDQNFSVAVFFFLSEG